MVAHGMPSAGGVAQYSGFARAGVRPVYKGGELVEEQILQPFRVVASSDMARQCFEDWGQFGGEVLRLDFKGRRLFCDIGDWPEGSFSGGCDVPRGREVEIVLGGFFVVMTVTKR